MLPVQAIAKKRGIKRSVLPLAALLFAAAVIGPPLISLNGLHHRIADSISQAIGRPVRMSSVKMRLLPRPGFEIADFVVDEDPAFGVEPILRSSQVIASVRLLPLWKGQLEIARIAFDEPSLNLVRNRAGRWNFDALLSQAAQIPKAPTADRNPRGLPRFPYIDASDARVNFKAGDEKLPFSFFSADLAVWLENPGKWRIEFAAQPVRTDLSLDLANTGRVRLNGSLRRAPKLNEMPMELHAEWANAPLGQLSRIVAGSDQGWRGQLNATAEIIGTIDHASLKLTVNGQSIHRAEFSPREPLDLTVTCQASFTRADRFFDGLTCLTPTGDGHLLLTGSIHANPIKPYPELSLELNNVPVASTVNAIRLLRSGFGTALNATGAINGNFTYAATVASSKPEAAGQASVNRLTISGSTLRKPLELPPLLLSMTSEPPEQPRRGRHAPPPTPPDGQTASLLLEPFVFAMSPMLGPSSSAAKPPPTLTVGGAFSWNGFSVHLGGQSQANDLAALGKAFGLIHSSPLDFGSQGTADLDLTIQGPWMLPVTDRPLAPAALTGNLRLHNAQVTGSFLAQPMHVPAAQATFTGNTIDWAAPSIIYGPIHADGTLSYAAFCASPSGCVPHFNLHIASLDAATAQSALLGAEHHGEIVKRLLDRISSMNQSSPSWPALQGILQIGTLTVEQLDIRDLNAEVGVLADTLQIKSSSARTLDGQLHLSGSMQVAGNTPHYEIETQLDHASASAFAALFDEKWGPGTIDVHTSLKFSGFEQRELLSSATGTFLWEWAKGGLPADASLLETSSRGETAGPSVLAHFDNWTAEGVIGEGRLTLRKSSVLSGNDSTSLLGTISFARELHLTSAPPSGAAQSGIMITGTLSPMRSASTGSSSGMKSTPTAWHGAQSPRTASTPTGAPRSVPTPGSNAPR